MADKLEVYTKGTKAWFPDKEEGYVVATLLEVEKNAKSVKMKFMLDSEQREEVYEQPISVLEKNNYESLPMLKNPPRLEGVDDLTTLSYLHEAAVLHSVKLRYQQEIIYTYSGLVLIAMNPFKRLNIYTEDIMRQYAGRPRQELEPHLFAIAEESYRRVVNQRENQSVIVSGESGAGKTVAAKYVMKYFAIVDEIASGASSSKRAANNPDHVSIEDAVLSTNPIMEAFGNAKTTRNDNSSRFGKYIEIIFKKKSDVSVTITGAKIRTYLLERSRLTFQPESERNYHIFYQLVAACPAAEKEQLGLKSWDDYHYLRQGNTGTVNGVDDVEEFEQTQKGMSTVGISVSQQWEVFRVCAALLHIGNINITDKGGSTDVSASDPALLKACELLKLDAATFHKWLVKRQIKMRSEVIVKDTKYDEAITSRDSIAKFIYAMLFDWICQVCNNKLEPKGDDAKDTRFIGVLDIYGFEHFQKNSFEQFCINFANEKLQQEFTRHVFKLEQAEYVAEKISWSFIDFNDNAPCIEMIEGKLGIMDLLDEESRLPSGADKSLIQKFYNRFGGDEHKFFKKPRFGQTEFVVCHYAVDVSYQIDGFIEKNKDTVTDEQLDMLNATGMEFLKKIIAINPEPSAAAKGGRSGSVAKKPTLGSIFKNSLIQLMETLRTTNPHYIRCIKPNQSKVAFEYEAQNVLGQLIACGVLETIKISRAGYPSKQLYPDFLSRYYFLAPANEWSKEPKVLTESICKAYLKDGKFELGLTKVFFRAGQLALLEKVRSEKFLKIVLFIQKNIRRGYRVKQYKKMKGSIAAIQISFRKHVKRQASRAEREASAVLTLQKNLKMLVLRKKHLKTVQAVRTLQAGYRAWANKRDNAMSEESIAASRIWATWLMFKQRQEYKQDLQDIVTIQSLARMKIARKNYQELLRDARFNNLRDENGKLINTIGDLKNQSDSLADTNFALESKVVDLSITLEAKKKDTEEMHQQCINLGNQLSSLKSKFMNLDKITKDKNSETAKQIAALKKSVNNLVDTKGRMSREITNLNGMIRKRDEYILQLQHYKTQKDAEVALLREQLKSNPRMSANDAALKEDIHKLREQMQSMLHGKYQAESRNEHFFNGEQVASVVSNAANAARMSVAMLGSAAVAAVGTPAYETTDYKPLRPLRILPTVDESKPKERAVRMLEAEDLKDEVIDDLIVNLRIPLPVASSKATRQEIFFPSHLIGYLLSEMLQRGMVNHVRELSGNVTRAIQHLTMKFEDDYVSAFWLSNIFELLSIIKPMRSLLRAPEHSSQNDEESASAVLATAQQELIQVMDEIFRGWIREFKKRLSTMIIPAVIENQSLPGYICNQNAGLWSQWTSQTGNNTSFTIDQLINFLTKLLTTMQYYYMDASMGEQVLSELIHIIGVNAFNHILFRKNFATWKRGVQIQYNVSRLEEWCTGNGLSEATVHLQPILQASKILTLNKSSPEDIEKIVDVCYTLNATQIKKLLSLFYAADFDAPLSLELLKVVSNRAGSKDENLQIEIDDVPEFVLPDPHPVESIDKFIPKFVDLPFIQAFLSTFEPSPEDIAAKKAESEAIKRAAAPKR